MPEYMNRQQPTTREQTKERAVPLIAQIPHPRQLRRAQVGITPQNTVHVGLGNGQWLNLGLGSSVAEQVASGVSSGTGGGGGTTTRVVPGGANDSVQFNDTGVFGGFGSYDKVADLLTLAQMIATNYLETPEVRAAGDLTLKPAGDVLLPSGTALVFNA